MKTAARITLTLAGASALLAIWQPFGTWWQYLATAVLLLIAGTGLGATADQRITARGYIPEEIAEQLDQHSARQEALYGNGGTLPPAARATKRATNESDNPEHIIRPTYGKPTNGDDE